MSLPPLQLPAFGVYCNLYSSDRSQTLMAVRQWSPRYGAWLDGASLYDILGNHARPEDHGLTWEGVEKALDGQVETVLGRRIKAMEMKL